MGCQQAGSYGMVQRWKDILNCLRQLPFGIMSAFDKSNVDHFFDNLHGTY